MRVTIARTGNIIVSDTQGRRLAIVRPDGTLIWLDISRHPRLNEIEAAVRNYLDRGAVFNTGRYGR